MRRAAGWVVAFASFVLAILIPVTFYYQVVCVSPGIGVLAAYRGIIAYRTPSGVLDRGMSVTARPRSPLKFALLPTRTRWPDGSTTVFMPLHALVVPLTLSAWFLLAPSLRTRRRRRRGYCLGCGYDLTGNESGRCPECGEAV